MQQVVLSVDVLPVAMLPIAVLSVSVRCRRIPWVPSCVAQHTRVLIGDTEHFFVKCGKPRHQPASDSELHIRDVYIGDADAREVTRAIEQVDAHFPDGSYHILQRDCSRYVFCLCAALFSPDILRARFPNSCNTIQNYLHGFDPCAVVHAAGLLDQHHQFMWRTVIARLRIARALEFLVSAAVPAVDDQVLGI